MSDIDHGERLAVLWFLLVLALWLLVEGVRP